MSKYYSRRAAEQARAEIQSIALTGKLPTRTTPQDIRNANARREIEARRMAQEARL